MSDHIVVYRSESERIADQFWMDFWFRHPSIAYFIGTLFVIFIVSTFAWVIWSFIKMHFEFRQMDRGFKRRKW